MEMTTIITGIIGIIATVISSSVSWLFAKRKYNAEVDSNLIKNIQESLDFYKKLVDDTTDRLEDVLQRNAELESRNDKLEEEIKQLRNQVFDVMNQICLNLTCVKRIRNSKIEEHNE